MIRELGTQYLKIVSILSLGTIGHMCIEKIVMATGRTVSTMIAQLTGAIVNIVLDPIFIYGLPGIPAMGIRGAAIATVAGQFVSFFIIAYMLIRKCTEVKTGIRYMKPDADVLKKTFAIAGPAIIMQIMNPVMNYSMNLILGTISVSAVTAFGVYGRICYAVTMPVLGLNNASIPSAAFNRGAGEYGRVKEVIKYGQIYVAAVMAVFIAILQIFPSQIVGIFTITDESARLCVTALHIITCGYFFMGANYILQGVCQALGKGLYSLILTLIRTIIVLLPAAYLLSKLPGASDIVWWAVPAAELAGIICAVIFTSRAYRAMLNNKSAF